MGANHRSTRNMGNLKRQFKAHCHEEDAPCWLCGQPIDYDAPHDDWANDTRFELDHYYPVSTHPQYQEDPANFRASHAGCNRRRGNGPPPTSIGALSREWA